MPFLRSCLLCGKYPTLPQLWDVQKYRYTQNRSPAGNCGGANLPDFDKVDQNNRKNPASFGYDTKISILYKINKDFLEYLFMEKERVSCYNENRKNPSEIRLSADKLRR